jgi:butyrate kinase
MNRILVINPGGSSTKISVFDDKTEIRKKNIPHNGADLKPFTSVMDQLSYRKELILKELKEWHLSLKDFTAVVGRGGLMKEIEGGVYTVSEAMINDIKNAIRGEHASNLGCILASELAAKAGIPAFVVDPVSVDEFEDVSRITGIKDLVYPCWMHALNQKAVARLTAEKLGGAYKDFNFIVAHLGSGISIAVHKKGKMIDGSGGRTNGPFASDRSGGLPAYPLIELCYSGKYTRKEMVDKVSSFGGFYDYLGTKDFVEIEKRIDSGDAHAELITNAFIYQVSKEIASYGAALSGKVDRIIITGGLAHSKRVITGVSEKVAYLAPIEIVAGEMEMEALACGALRVLGGEEKTKIY